MHCKFQSVNVIQNYHNSHAKIEFNNFMTIVGCHYSLDWTTGLEY